MTSEETPKIDISDILDDDKKGVEKLFNRYGKKVGWTDNEIQDELKKLGKTRTIFGLKQVVQALKVWNEGGDKALDPGLRSYLTVTFAQQPKAADAKLQEELLKLVEKGDEAKVKKWIEETKCSPEVIRRVFEVIVMNDKQKETKCLLSVVPALLETLDDLGETPLFWVLRRGDRKGVAFFISKGAKLDFVSGNNETAFHAAADGQQLPTVLQVIKEKKWTDEKVKDLINRANKTEGQTPLHVSCFVGDSKGVDILCNAGAKINTPDLEGNTPLHYCITYAHQEALKTLSKNNPKIDIPNKAGVTPGRLAHLLGNIAVSIQVQMISLRSKGAFGGILEIGLQWYDVDDLDLHVVTPSGEGISYQRQKGKCGGELDIDANAYQEIKDPPPQEHIYWKSSPPTGKYQVFVNLFRLRSKAPLPFEVTLFVQDIAVAHFEGSVSKELRFRGEIPPLDCICTFNWNGSKITDLSKNGSVKSILDLS